MPHSDKGSYVAPERRAAAVGTHGRPAQALRDVAVLHRGGAEMGSIRHALEAQRGPTVDDGAPASENASQQLLGAVTEQ